MKIIDLRQEVETLIEGEISHIEPSDGEFTTNINLDTGYMICLEAQEIEKITRAEVGEDS